MSAMAITRTELRASISRASILTASTLAVLAGLGVRIALLALSHFAQSKLHQDLQIVGQEAGFIAWSLASGRGFADPFANYTAATGWLAPVFPALWSIGLRIFDPSVSDRGVYFCQLMNIGFSAATAWPIYWLGRQVFSARVATAAAWTWAFLPLAILFPLEWTWDQSLSALALAILLCWTYKLVEAGSASSAWSVYGGSWGVSALVNPTLCVLLPFLLAWVAACRRKAGATTLRPMLKVALLFTLVVTPWTIRNYYELDGFVFIKSNFGLELWLGNNSKVPANDVYAVQLHPMNNPQELMQLALSGEPGYMRSKQRAALAFIRANPAKFARLVGRRVLDTWTACYDSYIDKWIQVLHLSRAAVIFCSVFSAVSLGGLILALRKNLRMTLPLAFCVVLLPVPYYITHTTLRYRHPIDPVLTLFAAYAVAWTLFKEGLQPSLAADLAATAQLDPLQRHRDTLELDGETQRRPLVFFG
jgi:Dolichyl-phosphate-mannose-protein mannosyltransferase